MMVNPLNLYKYISTTSTFHKILKCQKDQRKEMRMTHERMQAIFSWKPLATCVLEDIRDSNRQKSTKVKTSGDLFCKMLAKQIKEMQDGQGKKFLKYQIQRLV